MQQKREEAQRVAAERGAPKPVAAAEDTQQSNDVDVTPWLRALGYPADRVRAAVAKCGVMPDNATLEDRVKAALRFLMPPHRHVAAPQTTGAVTAA